jgi:hypothetical protein
VGAATLQRHELLNKEKKIKENVKKGQAKGAEIQKQRYSQRREIGEQK